VQTDIIVKRWKGEERGRNELEENPPFQFCAVSIEIDTGTGLAKSITPVLRHLKTLK